ncbi:MAG: hypothetical protein WKG01_18945 [Kofleriaceae bacterium]
MLAALAAACGEDEAYVFVTVEGRPSVHDVTKLRVTLSNGGTSRTDELVLGSNSLPSTFTVTAPGRTGELAISVEALDDNNSMVGLGSTAGMIDQEAASVLLDSTDFVVNTEVAMTQELSNYTLANGFQLAAAGDQWMTGWTVFPCSPSCNMFGRRFDRTGLPVETALAAGKNQFALNTRPTNTFSTPALAANGTTMIAVWNQFDPSPATTRSIECRTFDTTGTANATQLEVAIDEDPDVVSTTALANGNFAIAWDGTITTRQIRSAIVRPDCTVVTVSTVQTAASIPRGSHLAAGTDRIMYAWTVDGGVHVRLATNGNAFLTNDLLLIPKPATESVDHVRVAPLPGGNFAVVVRWSLDTGTGPGRLELLRTNNLGVPIGTPSLVTDKSGSEFTQSQGFGVAARGDGALLVVWHGCDALGDGVGCGVWGRVMRPNGTGVTDPFVLSTTTLGDQVGPSAAALSDSFVVAWTDASMTAPDTSDDAVRARVIYPAFDNSQ